MQNALSEAATLHLGDSDVGIQRDILVYRTYIALKQNSVVLGEISADASTAAPLRAVRLLAQHAQSSGAPRSSALDGLQQLVKESDGMGAAPNAVHLMAATALAADGRHEDALRCVDPLCKVRDLEGLALRTVSLLAMNRRDLAESTVQGMQSVDDDSTLVHLCSCWTALAAGKTCVGESHDGLSETNMVLKDLSDRFGSTALLQNCQAAVLMAMGLMPDAQAILADAAGAGSNEASTNSNLAVVTYHTGGDAATAEQYLQKVRTAVGEAPLLAGFAEHDKQLQSVVAAYQAQQGAAATA